MAISDISQINFDAAFQPPTITSELVNHSDTMLISADDEKKSAFDSVFDSAVNLINQTNAYSNAAEVEELKFEMGETDSIHDLQIAQQKANIALQYTVAVRDGLVSAFKDLMNMQF
ncbi:MAG: flagellar hook-basal body complex protein FliE [Lachnospiraceae bacterium]|nr:flagellar hook-basal body complex protein FliE [Lachnospiraceae bacterium]